MAENTTINTVEIRAIVPMETVENALTDSYNSGYQQALEDNKKSKKGRGALGALGGIAAVAAMGGIVYGLAKHFTRKEQEYAFDEDDDKVFFAEDDVTVK